MAVVVVAALSIALAVVWRYTDRLLENNAAHRASEWAENFTENMADLPEMLGGEMPSDESVAFLEQAKRIADVWRFRLYGPDGRLAVLSNNLGRTNTFTDNRQSIAPQVLSQLKQGKTGISVRQGLTPSEPNYIVEATVPIHAQSSILGYVTVVVDATESQQQYLRAGEELGGAMLLILIATFGIPAVGYFRRTRQKEAAESEVEHLAYHDSLTGLKNRHAIVQFLEKQLKLNRGKSDVAIHFVDLDRFKATNDTLGHDAGDEMLRQISSALVRAVGTEGMVGRVGGDEFLIVQGGHVDHARVEHLASRVINALSEPFELNGSKVLAGASIGCAIGPRDGENATLLLKAADIALYLAKNEGRACFRVFHPEMDLKWKRRRDVESSLRTAVLQKSFTLNFQPVLDLKSGRIEGVEALLRLSDPVLGVLSPAEFIPLAEETGLIVEIGNWVIHEGCKALQLLPPHLKLALNLSPVQFERGDVVARVREALVATKILPSRLELEITESLLIKDTANVRDKLDKLKNLGVSIVLDDFGSGYSSLNYLWLYPFDKMKIDRSFIASLGSNKNVEGIVKAIVGLGEILNMTVTAEGIETEAQAKFLREMHCGQVQGYLFGRPMPMADFAAMLLQEKQTQIDLAYDREPVNKPRVSGMR